MLRDKDRDVRASAVRSLAALDGVAARPHLRALYDAHPKDIAFTVAVALKSLGDDAPFIQETNQLAQVISESKDVVLRCEALRLLGRNHDHFHRAAIEQALSEPEPRVREAAKQALDDLGSN